MDPQRFDALARSLAGPKTRRSLLGSLAAMGAGFFGARAGGAQVSQAVCGNVICKDDPGICNEGCVCCVFGNGNSRCMPPDNCFGTPTCASNLHFCPELGRCSECCSDDDCESGACANGACVVCPAGRIVLANGTCAIPCPKGGEDCSACSATRCIVTSDGNVCSLGAGDGRCSQNNAQCPVGQACSGAFCEIVC